ncbi:hypothetical protein AKJ37_03050 [candidate division MSBL1 archaeon SCGC-AAA259I09]|uniref:Hydrogenase/sulfur reductase subunit alpha n=3 Tax=candidate division MSBL1 TaxID=215777 RepID=A0A133UT55_9EURY|nr:hypothetical protein AKJ62_02160 [candidate division MSBL1 archaeon SCGC-AAA259D14]KXA93812.1 hypothetical protein AKJ66_00885 [candidate division MSBL1 archaeon SCGC-AAA259E22]KXA97412.1 hypothetical protein AKJ37_03050 [candidate division MSBL1 archaeon SCGC-AAA259I09]
MSEEVNLVERIEGHLSLDIDLERRDGRKIRLEIREGPRLFEGFLKGRDYNEIPFFASRICGFCPIVHNLSAIKALENAMNVSVNEQTLDFRRALNCMEFIQSHSAHLYFLTLPDFTGGENDVFSLTGKFGGKIKRGIKLRTTINSMIEVLGGRAVHPLTPRVGGFSKLPSEKILKSELEKLEKMKPIASETVDLTTGLDYPDFEAETNYLALTRDDEIYPIYDGHVITTQSEEFEVDKYSEIISEETVPYSTSKFSSINGDPFLTGALSRVNLNANYLSENAKIKMENTEIDFPSYNPYHNNIAQAIEIVHCVDEIERIYTKILNEGIKVIEMLGGELKNEADVEARAGTGSDAVEAPRGTLFHNYEVNEEGIVTDADILTPTAQSAANIERDINMLLSGLTNQSEEEIKREIRTLIRAYDPCVSCSVH